MRQQIFQIQVLELGESIALNSIANVLVHYGVEKDPTQSIWCISAKIHLLYLFVINAFLRGCSVLAQAGYNYRVALLVVTRAP